MILNLIYVAVNRKTTKRRMAAWNRLELINLELELYEQLSG